MSDRVTFFLSSGGGIRVVNFTTLIFLHLLARSQIESRVDARAHAEHIKLVETALSLSLIQQKPNYKISFLHHFFYVFISWKIIWVLSDQKERKRKGKKYDAMTSLHSHPGIDLGDGPTAAAATVTTTGSCMPWSWWSSSP